MTPEMKSTAEHQHKRAMEIAELAVKKSGEKEHELASVLYAAALQHEMSVVNLLRDQYDIEPSRSIICRSAATLALDCGKIDDAERIAATGLAGNAPPEIASELRDILFEVQYLRHVGASPAMSEDVVRLTISGPAIVGHRIDPEVFFPRIEAMYSIISRVQEKLQNRHFRPSSRRLKSLTEELPVQVEPSINGEFGVDFHTRIQQPRLKMDNQSDDGVANSTLRVISDVSEGRKNSLMKFCNRDEAYYRYFVATVRSLLPDGKKVKNVGVFTKDKQLNRVGVKLTYASKTQSKTMSLVKKEQSHVQAVGVLSGAVQVGSQRKSRVKVTTVVDGETSDQSFTVPAGITSEFLAKYWNANVIVTGISRKNALPVLDDIDFVQL